MEKLKLEGDGYLCPMAIIIKDDKVLLGLRNYTADKWKDISVWTVPGGRSDIGETMEDTLLREVMEETGIDDLTVDEFLDEVKGMKENDKVLMFRCNAAREPRLMEPDKFSEWRWFKAEDIPSNFVNPRSLEVIKKLMDSETPDP